MKLKDLKASDIKNKKILLKVDFNVPLGEDNGKIIINEDTRIKRVLPTIKFLIENDARILIVSHLGRPNGRVVENLRLAPVAHRLSELLERNVGVSDELVGERVQKQADELKPGEILMLENCRFHPEEKVNSMSLGKDLADLADVMVNDAFSVCHRAQASVEAVSHFIDVYPGFSFKKEVKMLSHLMNNPGRPFVAVVGGAKISDKVAAIRNISKIADVVLVGGGVANNFMKAQGIDVCKSYLEECVPEKKQKSASYVEVALDLMDETKVEKILFNGYIPLPKIVYPCDVIASKDISEPKDLQTIDLTVNHNGSLDKSLMFLDIGPRTRRLYREIILQAETIFWNGPMGVFEKRCLSKGTRDIARAIAKSSATTVLGGGDTINAVKSFDLSDRYDYISTAGGAALEFLSGKVLPGIRPCLKE